MKATKRVSLRALTECSIMIALSTVLSVIKIVELPYGGSVTVASMLPIVIAVYRHGMAWGFGTAMTNAVIQMLLGLKNFSYFTSWQSIVALALLDYIVAFLVFALSAIFKKSIKSQNVAMLLGVLFASLLRYVCHTVSGATIWAGLSIPTEAAVLYSLSYNATYMIPETIILVLATAYIFSVVDFRRIMPTRVKLQEINKAEAYAYIGAGLIALGALIADTAIVFSKLQDPESGEFTIIRIAEVNFLALGIVTAAAVLLCGLLVLLARRKARRAPL